MQPANKTIYKPLLFQLFSLVFLFLPVICAGQTFVSGNIRNLKQDSITFYYEENYIALEKKQQKVPFIQNNFAVSLPIAFVGKVTLAYTDSTKKTNTIDFFVQPQDSIRISFDAKTAENTVNFGGNNLLYNRNWYEREQRNKKLYLTYVKKLSPEKYLKYRDSLTYKESKFFEELVENTTKKDKKLKPTIKAMSHFQCTMVYSNELLKMKYPEQKALFETTKISPAYYNFLKQHGFQHNECMLSEDYRNFVELYFLFVYQNKYGVYDLQALDSLKKLYETVPTIFRGELTKSFMQARIIARVAQNFPAEAKGLYVNYLQQNPNSMFKKELESIVKP